MGFCQAGLRAILSPCILTMTASSASTVLEVSTSPLPVPSTMSRTCSSSKSGSWFLKQLHLGCLHESGPCRLAMCVCGLPWVCHLRLSADLRHLQALTNMSRNHDRRRCAVSKQVHLGRLPYRKWPRSLHVRHSQVAPTNWDPNEL